MGDVITAAEAADNWGVTQRRVQTLCTEGRIFGAEKIGGTWLIPSGAPKPADGWRHPSVREDPD